MICTHTGHMSFGVQGRSIKRSGAFIELATLRNSVRNKGGSLEKKLLGMQIYNEV